MFPSLKGKKGRSEKMLEIVFATVFSKVLNIYKMLYTFEKKRHALKVIPSLKGKKEDQKKC